MIAFRLSPSDSASEGPISWTVATMFTRAETTVTAPNPMSAIRITLARNGGIGMGLVVGTGGSPVRGRADQASLSRNLMTPIPEGQTYPGWNALSQTRCSIPQTIYFSCAVIADPGPASARLATIDQRVEVNMLHLSDFTGGRPRSIRDPDSKTHLYARPVLRTRRNASKTDGHPRCARDPDDGLFRSSSEIRRRGR